MNGVFTAKKKCGCSAAACFACYGEYEKLITEWANEGYKVIYESKDYLRADKCIWHRPIRDLWWLWRRYIIREDWKPEAKG